MTETGRESMLERLKQRTIMPPAWSVLLTEGEFRALLAVVEAAQEVAKDANALTLRLLDEALAALHSQASDEGKPAE